MAIEPEVLATPAQAGASQDESQVEGALTKLALASIGAVSLAEEAAENLLRYLVARGETDWGKARSVLGGVRRPRLRRPRPILAIRGRRPGVKSRCRGFERPVGCPVGPD